MISLSKPAPYSNNPLTNNYVGSSSRCNICNLCDYGFPDCDCARLSARVMKPSQEIENADGHCNKGGVRKQGGSKTHELWIARLVLKRLGCVARMLKQRMRGTRKSWNYPENRCTKRVRDCTYASAEININRVIIQRNTLSNAGGNLKVQQTHEMYRIQREKRPYTFPAASTFFTPM